VYKDNLLNLPGAASRIPEIVVMEPRSFEEASQAIQALRESKIVILKLSALEPNQAQRSADFVTGGTYAIDGHTEWIGEQTFLFTPVSVQVSTQKHRHYNK
jgi:cell division inhibitor SepF